jgi:hypothetical protein
MGIALWVAQILLALFNAFAGFMKATQPIDKLRAQMGWANDFSPGFIRFVAYAEIAAALGLILPEATGILPGLTPLAALGVAILQVGAFVVHLRRGEAATAGPINGIAIALALFIVWGRWDRFPF